MRRRPPNGPNWGVTKLITRAVAIWSVDAGQRNLSGVRARSRLHSSTRRRPSWTHVGSSPTVACVALPRGPLRRAAWDSKQATTTPTSA